MAASVTYDNTALTQRKGTWHPDRFLKHNLAHVFFDIFASKARVKVFIFLLDETEMTQNNSLFVWKTSNYSC